MIYGNQILPCGPKLPPDDGYKLERRREEVRKDWRSKKYQCSLFPQSEY